MKKKVLIVAHRWPPRYGGSQNLAYRYAELLKEEGYDITIITSKEKNYNNIFPNGCKLVEVTSNPILYNKFSLPFPIFNLSQLKKRMKEEIKKCDVVIICDRYYMTSYYASKYAKEFNKKSIMYLMTSIQNYSNLFKKIMYSLLNNYSKNCVKNSDYIIGISEETLDKVLNHYKLKTDKKTVIRGVLERIEHINTKKSNSLNILYVGRLADFKGVDLILKVANKLKHENKVNFIIVGGGPEKNSLLKSKEENKLDNVDIKGVIDSREEIIKLYKKCDVAMLLSKKREGFPISLADALVFGKPLIISKNAENKEFESFDLGYTEDDIDKIVSNIRALKENNKLYSKKSKEAFRFAKKYLNLNKNLKKLEKIINETA